MKIGLIARIVLSNKTNLQPSAVPYEYNEGSTTKKKDILLSPLKKGHKRLLRNLHTSARRSYKSMNDDIV